MRRVILILGIVCFACGWSLETHAAAGYAALDQAVVGADASGVNPCAFLNTGSNEPAAQMPSIKLDRDACTRRYGSWLKCLECSYNPGGEGCSR